MNAARANRRVAMLASLAVVGAVAVPAATAHATSTQPARTVHALVARVGNIPRPVADATATGLGRHAQSAVLSLNLGLTVRHSAELDAVIAAASTPGSAAYGHYLTPAQYLARYAPTDAAVTAVRDWLRGNGISVTGVSPDNLIVSAQATTATAERVFAVSVNDYRSGARAFFANAAAPTMPADLGVHWVTGLSDFDVPHTFAAPARVSPAFRTGGYFPSDFQRGYGVTGVPLSPAGRANDEPIGFTLWGKPLQQSDLTHFATDTGSQPVTINAPGQDGLNFINCSTSTCTGVPADTHTDAWLETALDVESAHGIAPGSHLKYWLGSMSVQGGTVEPDEVALEQAVNAAANDSTVKVVSNSWGFSGDADDPSMDASLQHAASVGKTFFFSTGDTGSISYPSTSPYVVAVGGTQLNLDSGFNYVSESAWGFSGNGCSAVFARPSWQIGVSGAATCSGRAVPDVAADADGNTGAYVFVGGAAEQVGGTSLAAPLWAGMTAMWNEASQQAASPGVGFAAPLLYTFANDPAVYHSVFHDVTSGSANGHAAGSGWDEVTGWGSPNLTNMVAQYLGETVTTNVLTASPNPVGIGNTAGYTATVTPTPTSGSVAFRRNGVVISGCASVALSAGHAHCSAEYGQSGTYHVQAAYLGNANFRGSASNTVSQIVSPAPSPPNGYWMVGATGDVYAFGADHSHGNAATASVAHFEPTPSRQGYWIVNRAGQVFAFGDARALGNASGLAAGETVSSLSSTRSGHGYWLFTTKGRVFRFGDAGFFGDLAGRALNQPVIGSVATPSGRGYYMVAADGGIFSFGDAGFFGSTGGIHLNKPVNGLVPTPTNRGYWMVASDGGIFAFGDAAFHGSMGGTRLNKPVVGMVRYGNGYLMVGSDGGIFDFSDHPFLGSLAGKPLPAPIVSVAS